MVSHFFFYEKTNVFLFEHIQSILHLNSIFLLVHACFLPWVEDGCCRSSDISFFFGPFSILWFAFGVKLLKELVLVVLAQCFPCFPYSRMAVSKYQAFSYNLLFLWDRIGKRDQHLLTCRNQQTSRAYYDCLLTESIWIRNTC